MSVKNGLQRTAKLGWIPLVLCLSGVLVGEVAGRPSISAPVIDKADATGVAQDQVWYDLIDWLIDQLMLRLNCGSPTIPDDVPVAMLMVVDCFASGGLVAMTAAEKEEFMITLDAAEDAMRDTPDSVPLITKLKFESTLKLMRVEVLVQP